jgi:nucleotide-binding universal stress UspA family protein
VPGDRVLIAGTGRESTRATIAATQRAASAGVDAVLVRTPSFFKPQMTSDVFVRHYTAVADASPVPVLLARSFQKGPQGVPLPSGAGELPFRRILVPVDGGDASLHAVPGTVAFAKLFGSEVDALCVEEPPLPPLGVPLPSVPRPPAEPGERATAAAEKAVGRFREYGIPAKAVVAVGEPAEVILETADARKSDLIAMATHGRSGASRWALGSVTERVLRHATLPMLVTRART